MKVVVGDRVFTPADGQPIAVFLNEGEKQQVAEMPKGVNLYAQFAGREGEDRQKRINWAMRTRRACEPEEARS